MKSPPTPALVRQLVNATTPKDVERIARNATRAQIQEILDSLKQPAKRINMPWYERAALGASMALPFAALPALAGMAAAFGGRVQKNRDLERDGNLLIGAAVMAMLAGAGLGSMSTGYSQAPPTPRQVAALQLLHALPDWLDDNKFIIPKADSE